MRDKNIAKQSESGFRFNHIYWLCKDQTFLMKVSKFFSQKVYLTIRFGLIHSITKMRNL